VIESLEPLPFSRPLLDAYVSTMAFAYEANAQLIDPDLGHDEATFRYMVYKSLKHLVPGNIRDLGATVESDNGALVVRQGGNSLRSYAIGRSEHDDPWTSFPLNRNGAPAAAAQNADQLRLFPDLGAGEATWAPGATYILGHCGTHLTGLRAVHLCLPHGSHADETVKRWIWVRTIYRADMDRPPLWPLPDRPRPVAPPVVPIPPMVGIRTSQS
jgi:hypothetical protein